MHDIHVCMHCTHSFIHKLYLRFVRRTDGAQKHWVSFCSIQRPECFLRLATHLRMGHRGIRIGKNMRPSIEGACVRSMHAIGTICWIIHSLIVRNSTVLQWMFTIRNWSSHVNRTTENSFAPWFRQQRRDWVTIEFRQCMSRNRPSANNENKLSLTKISTRSPHSK